MGRLGLGATEEFFLAESARRARLIRISPQAGVRPVYLNTTPNSIVFEGNNYLASNAIEMKAQSERVGSKEYDTEVSGVIDSVLLTNADLNNGVYRGAEVVEYIIDPKYPLAGALRTYRYFIDDVRWDGEKFQANVTGVQSRTPDDQGGTFSRTCTVELFSEHCTVLREDFLFPTGNAATITEVVGERQFKASNFVVGTGVSSDFFTFGLISWVGGDNLGRFSTVFAYDGIDDSFALAERPTYGLTVGDAFYVSPGCQKTTSHCRDKFDNIRNFQGTPFVRSSSGALDAPSSS